MRTTTIRSILFGVALAAGVHAELLPNSSESGLGGVASDAAAGSSSWFGMSVQDSGFLLSTGGSGSSNRSTEEQGFSSYYNVRSSDEHNESSSQLSASGSFNQAVPATSMGSGSFGTLTALSGVSDILAETINVTSTFASYRPVAAMTPNSSVSPQSPYANSWQLAPQAPSSTPYGTMSSSLNYSSQNASYFSQSAVSGSYENQSSYTYGATGYSYLNQFVNSYPSQATDGDTDSNSSQSASNQSSLYFGLMNAGVAAQQGTPLPYFLLTSISAQQALTTPPLTPIVVTNFGAEVPEPGTWALVASALAAASLRRRFRKS